MAKKEDGRRKFDLDKRKSHNFDLEKHSVRNFDLNKDGDEDREVSTSSVEKVGVGHETGALVDKEGVKNALKEAEKVFNNQGEDSMVPHTPPESGRKGIWTWLITILVLLIVLLIFWFLFMRDTEKEPTEQQATEQLASEPAVPVEAPESDSVVASEVAVEEEFVEAAESPSATGSSSNSASTSSSVPVSASTLSSAAISDIDVEAWNVIRGEYGDGQVRKNRLGARYHEIQNRVNHLKREGKF